MSERIRTRKPTSPGEVLRVEFLEEMGVSQSALARAIDKPTRTINEICQGRRAVSTDIAIRLSKSLGTSAEFWLNLQRATDLWDANQHAANYQNVRELAHV